MFVSRDGIWRRCNSEARYGPCREESHRACVYVTYMYPGFCLHPKKLPSEREKPVGEIHVGEASRCSTLRVLYLHVPTLRLTMASSMSLLSHRAECLRRVLYLSPFTVPFFWIGSLSALAMYLLTPNPAPPAKRKKETSSKY